MHSHELTINLLKIHKFVRRFVEAGMFPLYMVAETDIFLLTSRISSVAEDRIHMLHPKGGEEEKLCHLNSCLCHWTQDMKDHTFVLLQDEEFPKEIKSDNTTGVIIKYHPLPPHLKPWLPWVTV